MASKATLLAFTVLWVLTFIHVTITPATAQPDTIQIQAVSVQHEFPSTVTYRLNATAPTAFSEVELYWHATTDPTLTLYEASVEERNQIEIEHTVDMTVNFLPPGTEISYFWRLADISGNTLVSEMHSFQYTDQRFDWRQASAGAVTVQWYRGDRDFGTEVFDVATSATANLASRFQIELVSPVLIIVYGNDRDFSGALPPNSADWIGGVAYGDLNLIVAQISPGSGSSTEIQRLIPHEMSHLVVNQATSNPYNSPPNWLDEGLATYVQEVEDSRLRRVLDDAVREGRLIPVRALNSAFPLDDSQALLSYAESWSLIEFIIATWGDQAVADLLAIFNEAESYEVAVERTLGLNYDDLDRQWKAWLGYAGDDPAAMAAAADEGESGTRAAVLIAAGLSMALVCLLVIAFTTTVAYLVFGRRQTSM